MRLGILLGWIGGTPHAARRTPNTVACALPAGWHVHAGHSCEAGVGIDAGNNDARVGGHYFPDMGDVDPWAVASYSSWTSDSSGVAQVLCTSTPSRPPPPTPMSRPRLDDASTTPRPHPNPTPTPLQISWSSSDFTLEARRPVAGRTIVVHLRGGTRAACGIITPTADQFTTVGTYPGAAANDVQGLLRTGRTLGGIKVIGVLSGLTGGTSAGIHIHTGSSCTADATYPEEATKGHYRDGLASDPWTTEYNSDANGVATIDLAMSDFSLYKTRPVYGRAIVVHSATARVGCGVIGEDNHIYPATVTLGPYPGYTGGLNVQGVFTLRSAYRSAELLVYGVLAGLPSGSSAGWHVHAGHTCDNATRVGGHYYEGLGSSSNDDPWSPVEWASNGVGVAEVDMRMMNFTLQPGAVRDVSGRVIVVHAAGARVACGVISPYGYGRQEVLQMGLIPSAASSINYSPAGIVVERDTDNGLHFSGILTGVETDATAEFHVHGPNKFIYQQGYTCEAAGVGGHFFSGSVDVWSDNVGKVPWLPVADAPPAALGARSLARGCPLGQRKAA